MTTFFVRKNLLYLFAGGLFVVFVLLSFFYSVFLSRTKAVPIYTNFYFLVTEEMHVEAGAELIKLEGGAGYVLCCEGREYAVISVYLKEGEGESVHAAMTQLGKTVQILPVKIDYLYLKGKDKKKESVYLSALNVLKGYISLMEECVGLLDKGSTQESVKRILIAMRRQILYTVKQYQREYSPFSRLCRQIAEGLADVENEILYASELRYLSCQMVDGYLSLCGQFKL